MTDDVRTVALRWAEADPNPANARGLRQLAADDPDALAAAFAGRITFGTAGLRGPMGPGPLAMNALVVAQTARAIAQWLATECVVVVGYDARHGSAHFAQVVADVLAAGGHRPHLLAKPVATPIVAFRTATPAVDAGIVITASHNPPADNGMKIYAPSGSQIDDSQADAISSLIDPTDLSVPEASVKAIADADHAAIEQAYLTTIGRGFGAPARPLRVAYTPMHGVGGELAAAAMIAAGHDVSVVPSQAEPDPDFPTVPFPNPEEPGALDQLLAHAAEIDADIALAHDPDADRLAVAIRADGDESWRPLTGDEVGAILAEHLLLGVRSSGGRLGIVASTVVSSSLAAKVAAHHGATHVTTPTGFKHLSRAADGDENGLLFAYEEALGYAVNPAIRDKDGISAALVLLDCASQHRLDHLLARLHGRHGVHSSAQVSLRFDPGRARHEMATFIADVRNNPPAGLARFSAKEVIDVGGVLVMHMDHPDGSGRVCIRPSGTEPKVKIYLEVISDGVTAAADLLSELRTAAAAKWTSEAAPN